MIRVYGFLLVFVTTFFSTFNIYAQCTDSVRLAPDSLQWVLGGGGDANPVLTKYNDTLYIGGKFLYIGKYTGSFIGLNATTLEYVDQPNCAKANGKVNCIIPDGNGGIVIGGEFTKVGDSMRNNLAHINAAGKVTALSATFDLEVRTALVHNGILYVGGDFSKINGQTRNRLASFDVATGLLNSWNPNVGYNRLWTMATDGTHLYIGGDFERINGILRNDLASFDLATGALTAWNPGTGTNSFESVRTLHVNSSTLYVGGDFTKLGGANRNNIGAFALPTGTVTGFNPNADVGVHHITSHNGLVYAAGYFTTIGGQNRRKFAALNSSGSATNWNAQVPFFDIGNAIAVNGSTVYIAGRFTDAGGQRRCNFAALDITTGNALNVQANGYPASVADALSLCVTGNTIYVGGMFASIGGHERVNIAGIDLKNNKVIDLKTDIFAYPRVNAIRFDNNKMYVGGEFNTGLIDPSGTIQGRSNRKYLACYDIANNYALTNWNPLDTFTTIQFQGVYDIALYGNHVYAGGTFTLNYNGSPLNYMLRVDKTTGVVDTWQPTIFPPFQGTPSVSKLLFKGSRLYIGGTFGNPNLGVAGHLMYHDVSNGAQGYAWFNSTVTDMTLHAGKLYLGGSFTNHTVPFQRNGLAAMDTTATGNLLNWDPKPDFSGIGAIAAHADKIYVGGYFSSIGGRNNESFAVLDTITGKAWPWNPKISSTISTPVTEILPLGDTVFVGGSMTDINGKKIWGLARFHFDNFTMPNATIKASANPACVSDNVIFTATTNVPGASYQWLLNGSKVGANSATYSYTPANNDKLSVDVKVVTAGCFTSDSVRSNEITMTVSQKATPAITVSGPATVQPGNIVNVTAVVNNAGNNYSITWRNKGVTFATTSTPSTSYTKGIGVDMITATIIPVGCYDTAISAIHPVQDGVGISHIVLAQSAFIYPNPASNMLHIEGVTQGTLIRLFDVVGKELHNSIADGTTESINIQNLAPGNYLLQLNDGQGERLVKPFIKK